MEVRDYVWEGHEIMRRLTDDQLELRFKAWPWDGQNPRDLTRGANLIKFAPRGAPAEPRNEVAEQIEMFLEGTPYA